MHRNELINKLNSFDKLERRKALDSLIKSNLNFTQEGENVNLHIHSFNSYHCEGWSPTRIAVESKIRGLYASGIIDFDVLDGQHEFLDAAELLGLRASVGIETRAFLSEYEHLEIDSPGEPGVSYIAGAGFVSPLAENSAQAKTLAQYRETSKQRNQALIHRINLAIPAISVNYDSDVLPLTPSGNATERHIIKAYINKSNANYPDKKQLFQLWGEILGKTNDETEKLFQNTAQLEDLVRSKLAKKGSVGYLQPTSETFPKVEEFFAWVRLCNAIPLESWLDGTSKGEENGEALLELSRSKGAAGLNIIPDRNWNIKDPETKSKKYKKLQEIISIAEKMNMPIHIGTEMNKAGLPFVDDLEGADLNPFKNIFLTGTQIFIGHAVFQRFAGFAYAKAETDTFFKNNIKSKNQFFAQVGSLQAVNKKIADMLRNAGNEKAFEIICNSAKLGKWVNN